MAKLGATELAQQVIDRALQLHGARGVRVGEIIERLYRDIRALRIYEGASEVQRMLVGREMLKEIAGSASR
jgi:acyl-CoA dehydrogenase